MSHRKRLLILNPMQFGYHSGTYNYCKWAPAEFQITYHGFDAGRQKLDPSGVEVQYVSRHGDLVTRYVRFLRSCLVECGRDYDVIFVKYFPGCSLLRWLRPRCQFVLDIRTGSVAQNPLRRRWEDLVLRVESLGFQHVTIISASLARKLGLAQVHILPLGADPIETSPKEFSSLRLLYVGTLNGRRIEDTVKAFHRLYEETDRVLEMTYDVIGDGFRGERDRLRAWVKDHGLQEIVSLPGYIHQRDLAGYYEKCNVGVSYIPINPIYDCQPPTKTFEYLLAGLPVIATNTSENATVITERNGLLTEDTPEAFYRVLKKFVQNRHSYCSDQIRRDALQYSWESIVHLNLIPYFHSLTNHQ